MAFNYKSDSNKTFISTLRSIYISQAEVFQGENEKWPFCSGGFFASREVVWGLAPSSLALFYTAEPGPGTDRPQTASVYATKRTWWEIRSL